MRKILSTALLIVVMIALSTACCNEETYELTINGLQTRALFLDENSVFIEFDRQDPIAKADLILEIVFTDVQEIVSAPYPSKEKTDARILEAAVVPCEDPVVIYKNNVQSVKVEFIDPDNNNARIDVTDLLVIEGSQTSIPQYISETNPGLRGFVVELSDTVNIPDRVSYEVQVILDDGAQYSTPGGTINFN